MCFSMYAASSRVALGTIPGSIKAALARAPSENKKNQTAINGTTGETWSYK